MDSRRRLCQRSSRIRRHCVRLPGARTQRRGGQPRLSTFQHRPLPCCPRRLLHHAPLDPRLPRLPRSPSCFRAKRGCWNRRQPSPQGTRYAHWSHRLPAAIRTHAGQRHHPVTRSWCPLLGHDHQHTRMARLSSRCHRTPRLRRTCAPGRSAWPAARVHRCWRP